MYVWILYWTWMCKNIFPPYLDQFRILLLLWKLSFLCRTSQIWTSIFALPKSVKNKYYVSSDLLSRPPPRWIPSTAPGPPQHPVRRNCRKQRGLVGFNSNKSNSNPLTVRPPVIKNREAPRTQKTTPPAPAMRKKGMEQTPMRPYCWARLTSWPVGQRDGW